MNLSRFYKPWKIFTLTISVVLFVHFLKDITQDLLGINTLFDVMGNIQEDATRLPMFLTPVYWLLWIIATIAQPIIGYLTLRNWKSHDFNKYDWIIFTLALFFLLMISWAYFLSI
jgi:membrane-associated PAP2 superfamily phosphatase